jgi:hypothetical protein
VSTVGKHINQEQQGTTNIKTLEKTRKETKGGRREKKSCRRRTPPGRWL